MYKNQIRNPALHIREPRNEGLGEGAMCVCKAIKENKVANEIYFDDTLQAQYHCTLQLSFY